MPLVFTLEQTMAEVGLRQKELAEISGVRPNTISKIRHGDASELRLESLNAIIDAINEHSGRRYGLEAVIKYVEADE